MAGRFQRLVGVATNILGITLFILSVVWLVSNGARALRFLPERQEELFLEAGSIKLALSAIHLGYFVLTFSILLIACGKFLIRRDRINRLRS